MTKEEITKLESMIQDYCLQSEFDLATQAAIEGYGPEILSWLSGISQYDSLVEDAFQVFCLDIWQNIDKFRWESLFRTWSHSLAWHAFCRTQKKNKQRLECRLPSSQLAKVAWQVSSIHSRIHKNQLKNRLSELRQQLSEDTQTLLILRVDRGFSFPQIAQILSLSEEVARKRYQRAKQTLKTLAQKEGLLTESSS